MNRQAQREELLTDDNETKVKKRIQFDSHKTKFLLLIAVFALCAMLAINSSVKEDSFGEVSAPSAETASSLLMLSSSASGFLKVGAAVMTIVGKFLAGKTTAEENEMLAKITDRIILRFDDFVGKDSELGAIFNYSLFVPYFTAVQLPLKLFNDDIKWLLKNDSFALETLMANCRHPKENPLALLQTLSSFVVCDDISSEDDFAFARFLTVIDRLQWSKTVDPYTEDPLDNLFNFEEEIAVIFNRLLRHQKQGHNVSFFESTCNSWLSRPSNFSDVFDLTENIKSVLSNNAVPEYNVKCLTNVVIYTRRFRRSAVYAFRQMIRTDVADLLTTVVFCKKLTNNSEHFEQRAISIVHNITSFLTNYTEHKLENSWFSLERRYLSNTVQRFACPVPESQANYSKLAELIFEHTMDMGLERYAKVVHVAPTFKSNDYFVASSGRDCDQKFCQFTFSLCGVNILIVRYMPDYSFRVRTSNNDLKNFTYAINHFLYNNYNADTTETMYMELNKKVPLLHFARYRTLLLTRTQSIIDSQTNCTRPHATKYDNRFFRQEFLSFNVTRLSKFPSCTHLEAFFFI
ncbi:hypothetical protein M3Y95_00804600 [Aphelenchoides besseyi]|nr:hypothetical protein M3Y95_00804600 [Aphelenchoides besseyi]